MASNRQQRAARPKLAARWLGLSALLAAVASLLTLAACQTPQVNTNLVPVDVGVSRTTALSQSNVERGQPFLDVSIVLFQHETDALTESETRLHNAERHYFPLLFKEVLDQSGYWGAVRVLPEPDVSSELECEGRILHSHASELRLRLICRDATGVVWLDKTSFQRAGEKDYLDEQMAVQDPFRPLFYDLANGLAAALTNRFADSTELIRATALMRYGIALAPDTFSAFVRPVDDRFELVGLPAKGDPMRERITRIRESEYLFVDAVDEAYNEVLIKMVGPYRIWRQYQYEFETYNQLLGADDRVGRQQLAFDYDALLGAYRRYQDYRRNQDELEEMADSLNRSLAPTLAEVEGRVLELSGNLAGQYRMWRSLLRQLYREERVE